MFIAIFAGFYAIAYIFLSLLSAAFFGARLPRFGLAALRSVLLLSASIALVFVIVRVIPDAALGNRFQHAVGGGVLGVVLCYRIFADHPIRATRLQFFIWTALIVLALGIANELFEFVLQERTTYVFANTITDTWFDLASNTLGIALAAPVAALLPRKL